MSADDYRPALPYENWKERLALAYEQTGDAEERLAKMPGDVLRWPWPELDMLTGPMGLGGTIWFLVALSGSGKTTFVSSLIEALRNAGKKIYVMPLETDPEEFRATLACMTLAEHPDPLERMSIDPGDVNSGNYLSFPNAADIRKRLGKVYRAQRESPYLDQVMIADADHVNAGGLAAGFRQAADFGADILIVDHIDHLDGGKGHVAEQTKHICHTALRYAKKTGITALFTSQMNFDIFKGSADKLAKYQPPQIQHMKYPTHKVEVATGIIGLSRLIRPPQPMEDPKAYAEALKVARGDEQAALDMLVPGVTQVNAMKLRNYGSRTGQRTLLGYDHGRLVTMPERDKYQIGFGGSIRKVV